MQYVPQNMSLNRVIKDYNLQKNKTVNLFLNNLFVDLIFLLKKEGG